MTGSHGFRAAALVVAMLLPAAGAAAQDIVAQIQSFEGRTSVDLTDIGMQTGTPISLGECESGAIIGWRFTGVNQLRANLHFYYGTGCDDPDIRTNTVNSSCTDLEYEVAIENRSQVDAMIPVSTLIDCTGSSGTRTIWVLAIDEPVSTVTGAGEKLSFPIAFDFTGPAAPSGFSARDGETGATLTWEGSTDQVTEYDVYFVPGGCSGGTPTVEIDPSSATPFTTIEGTARTYTVVYDADTPLGTESAVAIRARDRAGNVSELSTIACVTRIEVTSWWDSYCGSGSADACGGSECSVRPGLPARGFGAAALALALGALLLRRRR